MTDAERAALRDEIEGLTIRQARARGEVAAETLRILSELGIVGGAAGNQPAPASVSVPVVSPSHPPTRAGFFSGGPPSDAELEDMRARKAALVALNKPEDMPEEIQRAERTPRP